MTAAPQQRRRRLFAAVALFALLAAVGRFGPWGDSFSFAGLSQSIQEAGSLGFALFLGAFCILPLVQVPGLLFIALAMMLYGPTTGAVVAYGGAVLSTTVSFLVVRSVGGDALRSLPFAWAQKALSNLEERPVRTVVLLRMALWMIPPLNYALALSGLRFRHHFIGTALGLILPILGAALFSEALIRVFAN